MNALENYGHDYDDEEYSEESYYSNNMGEYGSDSLYYDDLAGGEYYDEMYGDMYGYEEYDYQPHGHHHYHQKADEMANVPDLAMPMQQTTQQ